MTMRIPPIGPKDVAALGPAQAPTVLSEQRAVRAQAEVSGGATNYAAQAQVQKRQDVENRKKVGHLIDRRIVTATLAALEPVGTAHDEDEADAEREQQAFGSDFSLHPRIPKAPIPKGGRRR